MTIQDVRDRLGKIEKASNEPESAHLEEDGLWMAVLGAIAQGSAEDPVEMARLALTSDDMDFPRWYA